MVCAALGCMAGGAVGSLVASETVRGFGFEQVCDLAREAARGPYPEPVDALPEPFAALTYDAYRAVHFKPEHAIWRQAALPFQLHLFHRGYLFRHQVRINLVTDGEVRPVAYRHDLFSFPPGLDPHTLPPDPGFAGFRVVLPSSQGDASEEIAAFLGASYFRAIGRGQAYGSSARGLAVDIGLGTTEEFPLFEEFWIVRPAVAAKALTIYALLNSPSVTGGYQFEIQPGDDTRVDVTLRLFPRRTPVKIGIAPMSSMFLRGEMSDRPADDPRPEVHDSDGLLIADRSGEWLWRPLAGVSKPHVSRFTTTGVRGFGLLQRDGDFEHYRDREALYDKRPTLWVEPGRDWSAGDVELLELPATDEYFDNVAACWVLSRSELPADGLRVQYRLTFRPGDPPEHTGGKAVSTSWEPLTGGARRFAVNFSGPSLRRLDSEARVRGDVTVDGGRAENVTVRKNQDDRSWQLAFDCVPINVGPVQMRAFVRVGDDAASETWSYTWHPLPR